MILVNTYLFIQNAKNDKIAEEDRMKHVN
jgi:hypothetical protein